MENRNPHWAASSTATADLMSGPAVLNAYSDELLYHNNVYIYIKVTSLTETQALNYTGGDVGGDLIFKPKLIL